MSARTLERIAGAVTLASMVSTPFTPRRSRRRVALTWVTVVGGAARTWSIERRRLGAVAASRAGVAMTAGTLAAELVGTRTGRPFGRYTYSGRLAPTVGGVPILVPLAWYAAAPPARTVADRALGRHATPLRRVGLGAAALTAWDLFLDPQMVGEGFWRWTDGGRYRGIPLDNFVGWFAVAAGLMTVAETTGAISDDDAHVTTYATLGLLETLAFATFWRDPLVALVGGLAMLPVAGTALSQVRSDRAQRPLAARAVASTRAT